KVFPLALPRACRSRRQDRHVPARPAPLPARRSVCTCRAFSLSWHRTRDLPKRRSRNLCEEDCGPSSTVFLRSLRLEFCFSLQTQSFPCGPEIFSGNVLLSTARSTCILSHAQRQIIRIRAK